MSRKIRTIVGYKDDGPKSLMQLFLTSSLSGERSIDFELVVHFSFSGSLAGVTAQCLVFPGDTIRKRMMSNGVDGRKRIYE